MQRFLSRLIFRIWNWHYFHISISVDSTEVQREKSEEREKRICNCICVKQVLKGKDPHEVISDIKRKARNNIVRGKLSQARSARIQALDSDRDNADDLFSQPECPICLQIYEVGDNLACAKTYKCNHIFHEDCIKCWLKQHNECPLCRVDMLEPSDMHKNPDVTV